MQDITNLTKKYSKSMGGGITNENNTYVQVLIFSAWNSIFFKSIISERMKSTTDFFPVIKTRLVAYQSFILDFDCATTVTS